MTTEFPWYEGEVGIEAVKEIVRIKRENRDYGRCTICGSNSPSHIQEDDEGPCRETPRFSEYFP